MQKRNGYEKNARLVPPAFFWQGVSRGWRGMAAQHPEHRQLIPKLQIKSKDHIYLKRSPQVRFSNSFTSVAAAVPTSSKIISML